MTNSQRIWASAVMISSTMPSAKCSCSGSPLILAKGNTAIDGLSGSGSGDITGKDVGGRRWRGGASAGGVRGRRAGGEPIDPYRAGDVLDLLVPEILEPVRHAIPHLFE